MPNIPGLRVGTGVDSEVEQGGVTNPLDATTAAALVSPIQGGITRVTAGGVAPGQVQKNYSGTQALGTGATTIALETVTAGRSYLITDVVVTISGSTGQVLVQLQFGGVNVMQGYVNTTKGLEAIGIETGPVAASGAVVQLVAAAASGATLAYNIYGVEQ